MWLLIELLACVIAGWLAGLIMKGRGYGVLVDLVLGLVGGWLGGFLFGWLFFGGGILVRILVRMLGAIVLVALVRLIRRR